MSIEAMKQALEALEVAYGVSLIEDIIPKDAPIKQAITALRTAIAEAEKQEPYAWEFAGTIFHDKDEVFGWWNSDTELGNTPPLPLYTTPPAAQRQPLTDEAIWRQYQALWPFHPAEEPRLAKDIVKFARAVEAAHGIKGAS